MDNNAINELMKGANSMLKALNDMKLDDLNDFEREQIEEARKHANEKMREIKNQISSISRTK